jgi:hypothetical protein
MGKMVVRGEICGWTGPIRSLLGCRLARLFNQGSARTTLAERLLPIAAERLLPIAEGVDVVSRAIAEPTVELGGVFELLSAKNWDGDKSTC